MKVLLLTVGGSDAPIVKSIKDHQPDQVIFLCSESEGVNKGSSVTVNGEGLVCKERECPQCGYRSRDDRPSIVKQADLTEDNYRIEIVEHDNPYNVYKVSERLIRSCLEKYSEVIVDYTGGTKSMSAGLAAAAMEHPDCKLSLVKGPRLDLVRVRDGLERVAKMTTNFAFVQKQMVLCDGLLQDWNYKAVVSVLEEMGKYGLLEDAPELERLLYLSKGFAAWDRFDYRGAVQYIELYKKDENIMTYYVLLKKINSTLDWYEQWQAENKKNPPGFMLVYDVLQNAKRRAAQGNYDDAVARIYRGLEMYAQFCLRTANPRLTSDDVDTSVLPEECRQRLEPRRTAQGKIKIGLNEDYELLYCIKHPVGMVWEKWREKILSVISTRNFSFLAHGMQPISEEEYQKMNDVIWPFIMECDQAQNFKEGLEQALQLPTKLK